MTGSWNHWFRRLVAWSVSSGISTCSVLALGAEEPRIRLVKNELQQPIAIEVVGLTDYDLPPVANSEVNSVQFAEFMPVLVGTDRSDTLPQVPGTYVVDRGSLRFTPESPFKPGLTYRVVLHLEPLTSEGTASSGWLRSEIVIPEPELSSIV